MTAGMTRREFIKVSSLAGGGLVVSVYLAGCTPRETATTDTLAPAGTTITTKPGDVSSTTYPGDRTMTVRPNIYVLVDGTGEVTLTAFRSEMGQGIRTAIAMILAEELDAEWDRVRIEQAPADPEFGNQVTGGSVSISDHYGLLREAGAAARAVLMAAAAHTWDVDPEACRTEPGVVVHPDGEQRLTYGELVTAGIDEAASQANPTQPWKDPADFRLIGTPTSLLESPRHVRGATHYVNDLALPGMRHAVIARCPTFGGWPVDYDGGAALAIPGVTDVLDVDSGVAVVADHTWAALQGREALRVSWDRGSLAGTTSAAIKDALVSGTPSVGPGFVGAAYDVPFFAHAALEPMGALADVRPDRCEVWAPSQDPQLARATAAAITGLPTEAVTVYVVPIGGKFGRGYYDDGVAEAVELSNKVGAPVKLVWTREDDMQHDRYHPMSRYQATVPTSRLEQPSVRANSATDLIPTGAWRSVENHPTAFARESLIDEVAAANGIDPLELRMQILRGRARNVTEVAASQAGWGETLPAGWGRGIAYFATFGVTHVAEVAEVSVEGGRIRVHRVVCAIDCGMVINPDTVRAQMEGGIVFGLTAALKDAITIEDGAVVQSNFHDYRLLAFDEMPEIEVHIVASSEPPTGVGEMGVPPLAPAVANAVFAATGTRLRSLPLRL